MLTDSITCEREKFKSVHDDTVTCALLRWRNCHISSEFVVIDKPAILLELTWFIRISMRKRVSADFDNNSNLSFTSMSCLYQCNQTPSPLYSEARIGASLNRSEKFNKIFRPKFNNCHIIMNRSRPTLQEHLCSIHDPLSTWEFVLHGYQDQTTLAFFRLRRRFRREKYVVKDTLWHSDPFARNMNQHQTPRRCRRLRHHSQQLFNLIFFMKFIRFPG